MVKVLITDKLAQEGIDLINATPGAQAVVKLGIPEDELANIIRDYDGLIVRSETKVTAKVLANPGRLKGVARAGVDAGATLPAIGGTSLHCTPASRFRPMG